VAVLVADRRGGAGRRGCGAVVADLVVVEREAAVAGVVAVDLVVAELAVVVVEREAAVPSSPRWRCWSAVVAVRCGGPGGRRTGRSCCGCGGSRAGSVS
jgi:hypothetical protein